jgi:hypothetical protein
VRSPRILDMWKGMERNMVEMRKGEKGTKGIWGQENRGQGIKI